MIPLSHARSFAVLGALAAALLVSGASAAGASPQRLGPAPPKKVSRVVTLAPSLTEVVLRLGRPEVLVGVSRHDEAPEVAKLPRVGGFVDPSVEAVLALKPELLLVQPAPGNQRPVEKLAELGVPVLAVRLHTVKEALLAIQAIGDALGRTARAKELVEGIRATRERIRAEAAKRTPSRVLVIYGFEPLVVAGPGSYADELLTDAGAKNVVDTGGAYVVMPLERALRLAPQVVIDASDSAVGRARVRALPGLSSARWVQPASKALLQPGPSLGVALEELAAILARTDAGTPPSSGAPGR